MKNVNADTRHEAAPTRRRFLRIGARAGAALAGCATLAGATSLGAERSRSGKLPIRISG